MRIKKIILLEDFKRMNEGLQSDLKKYIKKNKDLNFVYVTHYNCFISLFLFIFFIPSKKN